MNLLLLTLLSLPTPTPQTQQPHVPHIRGYAMRPAIQGEFYIENLDGPTACPLVNWELGPAGHWAGLTFSSLDGVYYTIEATADFSNWRAIALPIRGVPGAINLAWNPSEGNGSEQVTGYRVYYGNASGQYTGQRDVGNVTTAQIDNLPTGSNLFFAVTAYNDEGHESDFSNEVSAVPGNITWIGGLKSNQHRFFRVRVLPCPPAATSPVYSKPTQPTQ